jgi:uncharacterized OB-fold protein
VAARIPRQPEREGKGLAVAKKKLVKCPGCGERYFAQRQRCPTCGDENVKLPEVAPRGGNPLVMVLVVLVSIGVALLVYVMWRS